MSTLGHTPIASRSSSPLPGIAQVLLGAWPALGFRVFGGWRFRAWGLELKDFGLRIMSALS